MTFRDIYPQRKKRKKKNGREHFTFFHIRGGPTSPSLSDQRKKKVSSYYLDGGKEGDKEKWCTAHG